jgi:hypothetical protein
MSIEGMQPTHDETCGGIPQRTAQEERLACEFTAEEADAALSCIIAADPRGRPSKRDSPGTKAWAVQQRDKTMGTLSFYNAARMVFADDPNCWYELQCHRMSKYHNKYPVVSMLMNMYTMMACIIEVLLHHAC